MGNPLKNIRKLLENTALLNLENKLVAVFDTYIAADFEKAANKLEKHIEKKAPGLKLAGTKLSVRVKGMKGPVVDGEITKAREFGIQIANMIKE